MVLSLTLAKVVDMNLSIPSLGLTNDGAPQVGVRLAVIADLGRHGWADIGSGVMLPEVFTARIEVEGDHSVELDIAVDHGTPVCNAVRILRNPNRPSLTGRETRRLPLAEWVSYACSIAGVANQGATTTDEPWQSEGYRAAVENVARRSRRRNVRATPDFLAEVARIYRANADAPVEAVREYFGPIGHSTAARYVKLARDAGLLPATSRGKVTR